MQPAEFEYAGLKFEGLSLAGIRTAINLPQYSLGFDVAQGLPHSINIHTFLITHGHMDHASGIPYIIAQKNMMAHEPPRFIMPRSMVEPMLKIMEQWSLIVGSKYEFEFIGIGPGENFEFRPNLFIRPFPTVHVIPSQGYSLFRRFHKLREEFKQVPTEKIVELSQQGIAVTEERSEILVSFTGDTQIEFLDRNPEVLNSKILILETTYLDESKNVASARKWGHTHLDELLPRLGKIQSEKIVLIHTSARYSLAEAKQIVNKKLPAGEKDRVVLFSGR